ncbi:UDP-N-acetylmuramate:L-alanyl-gamma-D-glutamyl-meso-diaminopimelate ligase [Alkalimonas collagenimarina]|uniref:UDP-N-acetylmuramate--L-alanyl-gamma-D-glutamyl-meso-2,6-diaminoheptandioate ligase n=1 Tax=Alkalimonas collagenimarina TaxID=400390 RepID=A0ABT9GZH0_9GAMM|nr:UDP-N-acetylmuramate:L-alanyl-gamma-D-glutamyl-meso-diaminopimelate ligase [Alkalimonas collagenimarina]MDP4536259.1 UDP-N-acetylmuramate:L-alanyl-gamma-D-glutamyl-meso-diaminopimelate ligase [Alkalimonas collagenimarina]
MHIHILGICGTFMGGIAALAKSLGYQVTGSDANVYPPMSTQLEQLGITLTTGFDASQLEPAPDLVIIGNALSRGNPAVEAVLEQQLPYTSGAEWLSRHVLQQRWVLAVAGTHGKTSCSSMLTWVLQQAGLAPGFLIGGVAPQLGVSAQLGQSPFFVIEADEYDTAFFDKRSKFVHYRPRTLVINNLEYDHADIFPDLAAIQRQFHHLVRTVPASGLILTPAHVPAIEDALAQGCWSERQAYDASAKLADTDWQSRCIKADGSVFEVILQGQVQGQVQWQLLGQHNVDNAMMAIAAARHVGVPVTVAIEALCLFQAPKRRLELLTDSAGICLYDDFAHHPTAIQTTLAGLRAKVGQQRIVAVLEARSNTMKQGVHQASLPAALNEADKVYIFQSQGVGDGMEHVAGVLGDKARVFADLSALKAELLQQTEAGDHLLLMSNGGFGGLQQQLLQALQQKEADYV